MKKMIQFQRTIVLLTSLIIVAVPLHAQVVLTVNPDQQYQTWEGWEVTAEHFHFDAPGLGDRHPIPTDIMNALLDDAVNELGITGVRIEFQMQESSKNMEPINDNDDPFVLDDSKIRWTWVDPYLRTIALPMKQRVEALGDTFTLNFHAVAWGAWQWTRPPSDPGQEYAEFMMAALDHTRDVFSIVPKYLTLYNEPDNGQEGKDVVIRAMKKLADRMKAAGYSTRFRFPDTSTISSAVSWFDRLVAREPDLLPFLGHFSFHGYGGFSTNTLQAIRSRAEEHGLLTSQTEWWFTNNHPPDILASMREANVSLYQPYALGAWPNNNPSRGLYAVTYSGGTFPDYNYKTFIRGPDWYDIYHFSHFIRPGDKRIEVTSSSRRVTPVAFLKPNGAIVIVMNNLSADETFQIEGVPAGRYGITYSSTREKGAELPDILIGQSEPLKAAIPGRTLVTVFPKETPTTIHLFENY